MTRKLLSVLMVLCMLMSAGSVTARGNDNEGASTPHTITVSGGASYEYVSADKSTAVAGETVTLTVVTQYDDRALRTLTVQSGDTAIETTAVDASTYSFRMPDGDVTVAATFGNAFSVVLQVNGNGTVTADRTKALCGEEIVLTVTPHAGCRLKTLSVSGNGGDPVLTKIDDTTYTVSYAYARTATVRAVFEEITYTLSFQILYGEYGSVGLRVNGTDVDVRSEVELHAQDAVVLTVTPIAALGGRIREFTLDGADMLGALENGSYSFTMPERVVRVRVWFERQSFSVTADAHVVYPYSSACAGDTILASVSAAGYNVRGLAYIYTLGGETHTENAVWDDSNRQWSFTMPAADVTLCALISDGIDYTIASYTDRGDGTITVLVNGEPAQTAQIHDVITVSATAADGYTLDRILAKLGADYALHPGMEEIIERRLHYGDTYTDSITFSMPAADVSVSAWFEKINYRVDLASDLDAVTSLFTRSTDTGYFHAQEVAAGTLLPAAEYRIEGDTIPYTYSIDGTPYAGEAAYDAATGAWSLTMPAASVTLRPRITRLTYAITTAGANGSVVAQVNGQTAESAAMDDVVTLTNTPRSGFKLFGYTVTDATGDHVPVTNGSFVMPGTPVTVTGEFRVLHTVAVSVSGSGTLQASLTEAVRGETVTLTATPDLNNQRLETLRVVRDETEDAPAAEIETVKISDRVYTFTMPDDDVTIYAEFIRYINSIRLHSDYTVTDQGVESFGLEVISGGEGFWYNNEHFYSSAAGTVVVVKRGTPSFAEDWDSILWSVLWTDREGNTLRVPYTAANEDETQIRFIMPAGDVDVGVTFGMPYVSCAWDGSQVVRTTQYRTQTLPIASVTDTPGATLSADYTDEEAPWYVVMGNVTFHNRLAIRGHVHLILADGASLTLEKGVELPENQILTIYGQEESTGMLTASGGQYQAGIGGGSKTGGGNLIVHGGGITASGGDFGAGIGSGDEADASGTFILYYGSVQANGGSEGAGVGGGNETAGGDVTIYAGTLTAVGGSLAAGVGGGDEGEGGAVTIYGGKIKTTGGTDGAGIGGGEDGNGGKVVIYGGKVTARGYNEGAGIGGGDEGNGGEVIIRGGTVGAYGRSYGAGIGGGDGGSCGTVTIYDGTVTAKCQWTPCRGAGIGGGAGADQGGTITIKGGKVRAHSQKGAGIGGGYDGNGGTIVISGGLVTAQSVDGAGIGGGGSDDIGTLHGGSITVSGGVVIATSTQKGAGIGGGKDGDCGTVQISGGHVTATGGYFDYNFWQSEMSPDYTAFFKAGAPDYKKAVIAFILDLVFSGEYGGAGIGGGDDGKGGTVVISGGTVIATAGVSGARAVGHGSDQDRNGTLSVYDGAKVTYGTINGKTVQTEGTAAESQRNTIPAEKTFAVIEPCDHPDHTYAVNASTHRQVCKYCSAAFTAQAHITDESNRCTVCGYQGEMYTIRFVNEDGTVLQTIGTVPGTTPVYTGATPTKAGNYAFDYVFSGWTPELTAASSDATYTAVFVKTAKQQDWQSVTIRDRIYINFLLAPRKNFESVRIEYIDQTGVSQTNIYTDLSALEMRDGYYLVPAEIAPAQIGDTVRAAITADGGVTEYSTSVMLYCRYLLDGDFDEKVKALASATIAYGQAAGIVFDYHTEMLIDDQYTAPDKTAVLHYTDARFTDGTGLVTDASFMALSKPEFRFYTGNVTEATAIAYNKAGITAVYADGTAEPLAARFVRNTSGDVLIEVTGVSAENMDRTILVQIAGVGTITFNGNVFAVAMARSGNTAQQNLGAALFNYGAAAKNCFGV